MLQTKILLSILGGYNFSQLYTLWVLWFFDVEVLYTTS